MPENFSLSKKIVNLYKFLQTRVLCKKKKNFCPICKKRVDFNPIGWSYLKFLDSNDFIHSIFRLETLNIFQYFCDYCGSTDRDRLYALYFENYFEKADKSKLYDFIDFAPTNKLSQLLKELIFLNYRTADLHMAMVDDKVDLTDMKIYKENSFDIFLCSHVLEHIADDKKAISELYRILRPRGFGLVMAPILLDLKEDYENANIKDEYGRWKYFGQGDHFRLYSKKGFIDKLKNAGFSVKQLGVDYFSREVYEKYGIHTRSVLYVVSK